MMKSRFSLFLSNAILQNEKMQKAKITKLFNKLKPTENELKINISLLTLYLNHFNEKKFMSGRMLRKLF